MAKPRQAMTPVTFDRSQRTDETVLMTSGDPGEVICLAQMPLLRGDSAAGEVNVTMDMAELPRPPANGVRYKAQAWFVPKSAFPQFSGYDEFMHAYHGEMIKQLGASDRNPPPFYDTAEVTTAMVSSDLYKTLGLHLVEGQDINLDLPTAFVSVYNFRLQAHSSKLSRRMFPQEDMAEALAFPPAFWPRNRFTDVVADYERALIIGALDFDISEGMLPIEGIGRTGGNFANTPAELEGTASYVRLNDGSGNNVYMNIAPGDDLEATMAGITITSSLADIEKAKTTQAFAKLRSMYAGNNANGFVNDNVLLAELMQGFRVAEEHFKRPWLLDSKDGMFGMVERHATDSGNLDQSVSTGVATTRLSINVPAQQTGGMIIVTVEILPERIYERQSDESLFIQEVSELPDALRDVQRVEPVDLVANRRLDMRHSTPEGLYGYEPMNNVWRRSFTRLGGAFYQADPANPFTEQRSAIWQPAIVDPAYTSDHFLAPNPFPKTIFADTTAPGFEFVVRHNLQISGLTQFGDILHENNDEFTAVEGE